jgi:hypothetical protein
MSHLYTSPQSGRAEEAKVPYNTLTGSFDETHKSQPVTGVKDLASERPQPMQKTGSKIVNGIIDFVCVGICICMFIFAMLAYRADGNIFSSYEKKIMNIAKIVSHPRHAAYHY